MLGNLLFTLIFGESFVNNNNINNNFLYNNFNNNNKNSKNNEIFNSHITFKTNNYDLSKIDSEDKQLDKLIKGMLEYNPQERYSIEDIKKDNWTTKDGEFPMPDIEEEALEYFYKITSEEVIKANEK
jgi:serine/threonine protein kinase